MNEYIIIAIFTIIGYLLGMYFTNRSNTIKNLESELMAYKEKEWLAQGWTKSHYKGHPYWIPPMPNKRTK